MDYDFCGWATKNDLKCADGRTIRKNAFAANDGKRIPLVYMHKHGDISAVLGHAILENRDEGVYAYAKFNNSESAKSAKEAVLNGDITDLSIHADQLIHDGSDVVSGNIRELSLVLAGANPGAFIESVLTHGIGIDDGDEEGYIYTNEHIELYHADNQPKEPSKNPDEDKKSEPSKNPADILNSMTDEQKELVGALVAQAAKEAEKKPDEEGNKDDNEGGSEMKHSAFMKDTENKRTTLTHADLQALWKDAKRLGSLRVAIEENLADTNSALYHALDTAGMETAKGTNTYGIRDAEMLFPEAHADSAQPEFISRNMEWVNVVLTKTSKSPFSRIKSVFADITEDEARAKGYIKGKQKKDEVFALLKRATTPQTIYKRQKMDRDDIIDIEDFDVFVWIKGEMEVMLNEEKARAILLGDGRLADSEDKIRPENIRPIISDVALFNTVVAVPGSAGKERAKNFIYWAIKARKSYKGSGNPDLFTTEDMLTDMLLLENNNGERMYKTEAELATALRVSSIHTVEPMENTKLDGKDVLGIIVNLIDYKIGSNNKGKRTMFDDFDINFNQQIYLLEERFSGALTKPFAALTFVSSTGSTTVTPPSSDGES